MSMLKKATHLLVMLISVTTASSAMASDFWDEVKTPGLKAYKTHLRAASNALRSRHFDQAITLGEKCANIIRDRAEPHTILGTAQGELGQFQASAASFRKALELNPQALDSPPIAGRAVTLLMIGKQYDLAQTILARMVARLPPSTHRSQQYAILGDIQMLGGEASLKKAIQSYRTSVRDGTRQRAVVGLALALERSGEHEEAMTLAKSLTGDLRFVIAQTNLPPQETAARHAIYAEAKEEPVAHERWVQASNGVFRTHAVAAANRTANIKKKKSKKKPNAPRAKKPRSIISVLRAQP